MTIAHDNTLNLLQDQVNVLEGDISQIQQELNNLTYELRQEEALSITRDVDTQRQYSQTALQQGIDNPANIANADLLALAAAKALASPAYTDFPGRFANGPDRRFDPRGVLPTFCQAVSTWMALHKAAAPGPWDQVAKDNAATFIARLNDILTGIKSNVLFNEHFYDHNVTIVPRPVPRPPIRRIDPTDPPTPPEPLPTKEVCQHTVYCQDLMAQETLCLFFQSTDGACSVPGVRKNLLPDLSSKYMLDNYNPDGLMAIAAAWKATAGL